MTTTINDGHHDQFAHQLPNEPVPPTEAELDACEAAKLPRAKWTRLSDVEPQPIQWLWRSRIALGKLTLLVGDPGLGKSFLTLDLAARVSTGAKWPDGSGEAPCGSCILLSAEDDVSDTVRPRFDVAGGNPSKIAMIQSIVGEDQGKEYGRWVDLSRDCERIEAVAAAMGDCRMVVIDPISAYLGTTKSHNNEEVRGVLGHVAAMASRLNAAVIGVTHLRKNGEGSTLHRSLGSIAFIATARAAFAVVRDVKDGEGGRRLFLPIKNNIGNDGTGLAFALSSRYGDGEQPCVTWEAGVVETKVDEALTPPRGRPASQRDEAIKFLREALADGPRSAADVFDEAENNHGLSERTIKRAKQDIGVVAKKTGFDGAHWQWRLPDDGTKGANVDKHGNMAPLAPFDRTRGKVGVSDHEGGQEDEGGHNAICRELAHLGDGADDRGAI